MTSQVPSLSSPTSPMACYSEMQLLMEVFNFSDSGLLFKLSPSPLHSCQIRLGADQERLMTRGLSEVGSSRARGPWGRASSQDGLKPLTTVRRYPGFLSAAARGPELPSPRSAAPRWGAVPRLPRDLAQTCRPMPSPNAPRQTGGPLLPGPIPRGLSRGTHPWSRRGRT